MNLARLRMRVRATLSRSQAFSWGRVIKTFQYLHVHFWCVFFTGRNSAVYSVIIGLNLTISEGTLSGLIFYANTVHVHLSWQAAIAIMQMKESSQDFDSIIYMQKVWSNGQKQL